MPRYHFNIIHRFSEPDTEGSELANIQAARMAAVRLCGELIKDLGRDFWDTPLWRLEVTDAGHNVLFTLTFSDRDPYANPG